MKIKPNLFLNMSPQTTEEGGLAFARNMKLDDDGNLVSDYGYRNFSLLSGLNVVGHIVGLDNKIYLFCHTQSEQGGQTVWSDKIVELNDSGDTYAYRVLDTNWTYSGGEIDGYVNTNQSGEKILTIAEYSEDVKVPLKHINLSFLKPGDESLYCQAPTCPTVNLILKDTYVKTIPNGVYVFFIRYKIRKDVYTNWFLCSRPIFGGTSEKITTLQGGLSYINLHRDSAKSFVFQLEFAIDSNKAKYKEFQLGFIITHDEATDARMWKHFNMSDFTSDPPSSYQNLIYFDYEDVSDANIDDLLETTYELYNVRNVTAFKNKLYISNYIETNFNEDVIRTLASKIHLSVVHSGGTDINYRNLKIDNIPLSFNYAKGYYDKTEDNRSIASILNSTYFNYDISKLAKTSSKEKFDVLLFDIIWKGSRDEEGYDPDIAIVYNIYNNLYNKVIFGNDYPDEYKFNTDVSTIFAGPLIKDGMGINRVVETPGNLFGYRHDLAEHPWYALGFTFAFGSFDSSDVGSVYARAGAFAFNSASEYTQSVEGISCWITRDSGFIDSARSFIDNELKRQVEEKSFWGKAYLEITSGGNVYTIDYNSIMDLDNYAGSQDFVQISNDLFSTETISESLKSQISGWIYNVLSNSYYLEGVDESGTPILNINGNYIRPSAIAVKFKKFDFKVEIEDLTVTDAIYNKRYRVSMTTTDYTSVCSFGFKNSVITISNSDTPQESTLMPLSTYQPYIHFVDNHNIVTNGVKLGSAISGSSIGIATSTADVISLNYTIDALTNEDKAKYKSFFISLVNIGDLVVEGFGYTHVGTTHIVNCIEIDTLLYNVNDNITVKIYNTNGALTKTITNAKYYSSGSSYPILAFGNCGYVTFEDSTVWSHFRIYIVISRNRSVENINSLEKSSGYMPFETTAQSTPVKDGYYGAWLSLVKKPSFDLASTCYVSGNDVYSMDRSTSLALRDFNGYVQVQNSVTYFIRSNYNLNYLSLTEDVTDKIFPIGGASSGVKQVAKVINSAILSFIYELKPMYKDFANKYFRRFDSDYRTDFDNTVRVSHVLSDETFNNSIFKFSASDYYNVPTDRGVIVNLFSIGNNIFVHTKSSFYKFDGNQTIASNNNDIQLQESEPFETGVTQIFDSEYGYGGIDTKQSGCVTFDSYFFYDKSSNHIFAYSGNSQIQIIDGNIYKLLAYYKIQDCKTLHDELNCRVFFEFTSGRNEHSTADYKTFTLSYNYKTKTFVSLHDLSLVNAFAGHHRAYSYKDKLIRLFDTERTYTHEETIDEEQVSVTTQIDVTPLVEGMSVNKIFGEATTACIIEFGSQIYKKQTTPFGIAVVLFPQTNIKEVVDSVKYISDIQQKDPETQSSIKYDVLINPQVTRNNPVVNFFIVTDSCVSSLVNTNVNDEARPNSLLDYKGFKYDMGFWTSNFFRNDINKTNIYEYPQKYPNRALDADNNSLVYGRYFIFIFDFKADTPIKFEELFMNTDKY